MFTVRWKRSALNELAALWTQADSVMRQAITTATNRIDQELQHSVNRHVVLKRMDRQGTRGC